MVFKVIFLNRQPVIDGQLFPGFLSITLFGAAFDRYKCGFYNINV